jgi:PKD repeat protein
VKLSYKNIIHFLLISSFAFLVGCDDEIPFPTTHEGETVFHINGQLDNDVLELEAGKDNFYMYTDFQLNNENILQLSGTFQKNDLCTDICDEKLKIIFNNNKEGLGFDLDSVLYLGNYTLEPSIQSGNSEYILNFNPILSGNFTPPLTYSWLFGNGNFSTIANPTQTYIDNNGYTVKLEVNTPNNHKASYQNTIDNFNNPSDCAFSLDYTFTTDSTGSSNYMMYILDSVVGPTQPTYDWLGDFGSGMTPIQNDTSAISISIPANIPSFEICVNRTSSDCNSTFCKTFDIQGTPNYELSFDYNLQTIITPGDSTFFSMVIIEYTTPDGIFYSSELGSQTSSTFEILSIIDHDNNERGQTTKKIEATVNCKLYNQNGSSLDFISNDLIFGISIPQ